MAQYLPKSLQKISIFKMQLSAVDSHKEGMNRGIILFIFHQVIHHHGSSVMSFCNYSEAQSIPNIK